MLFLLDPCETSEDNTLYDNTVSDTLDISYSGLSKGQSLF